MATHTGTAVISREAKAVHAGLNGVYAELSVTGTMAGGSMLQMLRLPENARVVDGWIRVPGAGTYVCGLRGRSASGSVTGVDNNAFLESATAGTGGGVIRFFDNLSAGNAGGGVLLSITDSNIIRYRILTIELATASGTTSGKYGAFVQYYMDDDA